MLERGAAALFLDPGLGKTSITAAALKVLRRDGQLRAALVIAPLRVVKLVWPAEFTKWADFNELSVGVIHGDHKMKVVQQDHDVYVTNHATIPWLFTRTKVGKVWKYHPTEAGKILMDKCNVLVLDELSKFKHTDTQRFRLIKPHLRKFDRRYGLTGSPASNGLLDLFGQCYVLDEGRSLGPYVTHYREQYFAPVDKSGFTYRIKHGAEELIYDRIRPLALRMAAEDYIELPTLNTMPIKMDLPPKVRQHYEDVENDFLTLLSDGELLTTPNSASAKMMLRQMCSGAVYKGVVDPITGIPRAGKREWVHMHDEKLDALEDLLDELQGQQLLIGYDFQHDLERIQKRFPDIPRMGKSDKEDARLEAAWNAGDLPYMLGHPGSVGHGLNLQASSAYNIAWFTMTWDYELYDQFNRRLRRSGNTAKMVNCYQFMMRDTVEESLVAWLLRSKKKTQDSLLDALKSRARV